MAQWELKFVLPTRVLYINANSSLLMASVILILIFRTQIVQSFVFALMKAILFELFSFNWHAMKKAII